MGFKKYFLISFIFVIASRCAFSQTVQWSDPVVGSPISTCFESKNVSIPFTISGGVLTNGSLQVSLANGLQYAGNFSYSRSGSGPVITYDVSSPINKPRFIIGTAANSENITISFSQQAICGAVVGALSDTAFVYENSVKIGLKKEIDFDVVAASLSIPSYSNTPSTASAGQTVNRTVDIANQSAGGFVKEFYYVERFNPGTYIFDLNSFKINPSGINYPIPSSYISISTTNDSLKVRFDTVLIKKIGDLDSKFEAESFQLSYSAFPIGCGLITSQGVVYWGCGGQICQKATREIDQRVNSSTGTNLLFARSEPSKICLGSGNEYKIRVINNSPGYAVDVKIKVYLEPGFSLALYYHDTASVFYKRGANGTSVHPVISNVVGQSNATVFNSGTNCDYMGKPKEFQLVIPSIAPTDTMWVSFNTYYCAFDNYGSPDPRTLDKNIKFANYDASYEDFCGTLYQKKGNSLSASDNWTFLSVTNNSVNINAGETKPFTTIVTEENYSNPSEIFNYTNAYYEVTMVLPQGIEFDNSLGDGVRWYNNTKTTYWANSSITVNTISTVTVQFPIADAISTSYSEITFKLKGVDYTGSGGSCGTKGIIQYIRFVNDPANTCGSSVPLNVVYHAYNAYLHCSSFGACGGTNMYSFNMGRDNFGFPDNDDDGLPDGSGSIDMNKVRSERLLYGDTIRATYKAKIVTSGGAITSFSNLYASLHVESSNAYASVGTTATIKKANGSVFTGNIATISSNDTLYYDLATIGVNTFEENDSIQLDVLLRLNVNLGNNLESSVFTAQMYASVIPNPGLPDWKFCTDPYGKSFTVFGYGFANNEGSGGDNTFDDFLEFSNCESKKYSLNYNLSIGPCCNNWNGGNLFPYEVRRWAFLDSVLVSLPTGYEISSTSVVTNYRTAGSGLTGVEPTINTLNPIRVSGGDYTFYYGNLYIQNGGSYLNISDDGWIMNHIYTIQPISNVPLNTSQIMRVRSYHKSMGQLANSTTTVGPRSFELRYDFDEQLKIAPVVSSVNAITDSVIWTGDIQNLTPSVPAKNTWLYFNSASRLINIQRVKIGGVVIPPDANGLYQLGTLTTDQAFDIKALYRSCSKDSIKVYLGYDCFSNDYPATIEEAMDLVKDSAYFYIVPQAAQLSVTITSLASTPTDPSNGASATYTRTDIDMCTEFPVEIQLNNSQPSVLSNVQSVLYLPTQAGLAGLEFVSGSGYIEYPLGTAPRPFSVAANTALTTPTGKTILTLDLAQIDPANFGFSGLTGTTDLAKNKVILRFKFISNCNLQSGSKFKSLNKAKAPCGAGAVGNNTVIFSGKLNIAGVTSSYIADVDLTMSGTEFTNCFNTLQATVDILKSGSNPVQTTDSVYITMPAAFNIIPPILCSGTPCPSGTVTYNEWVVNGIRIISWQFPQKFNDLTNNGNGQTVSYSFGVRLDTINSSTPSLADIIAQVSERVLLTCNGFQCPNSRNLLGEDQVANIVKFPLIGISKQVSAPMQQSNGSFDVIYSMIVHNYGNVDLERVRVTDNLTETFPPPTSYSVTSTTATGLLALNGNYDGNTDYEVLDSTLSRLLIGDIDTVTVTVNIIPSISLGPFYNSAYVLGTDSDGCRFMDISTDGSNPDPNGNGYPSDIDEDIPTPLFLPQPAIGAAKTFIDVDEQTDGSYNVTYSVIVKNYWTETINEVQVVEDLTSFFVPPSTGNIVPSPIATGNLVINTGYNGTSDKFLLDSTLSTLGPNDADTITFVINIQPNGFYGPYYNSIVLRGKGASSGDGYDDISDFGTDPDPNGNGNPNEPGENDPTFIFLGDPVIGAAKSDSVVKQANGTYKVIISVILQNYGIDTLSPIQAIEDLSSFIIPPSTYTLASLPVATGGLTINTAFDGVTNTLLLDSAQSMLAMGGADTITFTLNITANGYYGPFYNSVSVRAYRPDGGLSTDFSDDGKNPDTNGNGNPNEPGENDSTIVYLEDFLAVDDNYIICIDSIVVDSVSANDVFQETVLFRILTGPSNGTALLKTTGSFTYTPTPGFSGTDSFVYTMCNMATIQECDTAIVTITVRAINRAPVAIDDYKQGIMGAGPYYIDVQMNDSEADSGQSIVTSMTLISGPSHGSAFVINGDSIQYTPDPTYCGRDTLTYEICDTGLVLCGTSILCDTANVIINITPTSSDTVCELPPNLPKGFSPNGDGQNDILYVLGGPFKELKFKIYNNWGELIFESDSQPIGWDGKRSGIIQAEGVYIATVFAVSNEGREYNLAQDVTLFR